MLVAAAALTFGVSTALADGSGYFPNCEPAQLASGITCWGSNVHTWDYTYGYNYTDNGTAICVGVGTGTGNSDAQWYQHVCNARHSPPSTNDTYCLSCEDYVGYGFVHNHDTYTDWFVGWGYYFS